MDHPELLTDSWLTPDGRAWDAPEATRMTGIRPVVLWELPEPVRVVAAAIQADHDDTYRLSISEDGEQWTELWSATPTKEPGLRERSTKDIDRTARFVRFEAIGGDNAYSASEVRLFCKVTDPFPPRAGVRAALPPSPDATLMMRLRSAKLILAVVSIFVLLVVMPRVSRKLRNSLGGALVALGLLGWIQFGYFQGKGELLHIWDSFHYYAGSKYFPELGYFDLYRCVAKAEREAGHGAELDRALLRNLEDSRIYPGTWAQRDEGACRATFSPERWEAFRSDVATMRSLFPPVTPFVMVVSDHGFNATPIHAAWLRVFSSIVPPTRAGLLSLAQIDSLALLGALAFVFWGFGVEACAVTALVMGLGFVWGYNWVGGTFGRLVWIFWLAAGLALVKRDRPFLGAVALSIAGLLRLFPFVFVGGMGIAVLVGWAKSKRLSDAGRHILAGTALTIALGIGVGGAATGFSRYRDFAHMLERHSNTPLTNQMGLTTYLTSGTQRLTTTLVDNRLTDPYELWKDAKLNARQETAFIWAFVVLCSLGLVAYAAYRGSSPWECAALSGPLLFSLLAMTSYDYSWIFALVCVALHSKRRLFLLVGYLVYTQFQSVMEPDLEVIHLVFSGSLFLMLILFSADYVWELEHPRKELEAIA